MFEPFNPPRGPPSRVLIIERYLEADNQARVFLLLLLRAKGISQRDRLEWLGGSSDIESSLGRSRGKLSRNHIRSGGAGCAMIAASHLLGKSQSSYQDSN